MKNIKTYEDFVNEEINLKKAAAGLALGASLLAGQSCDTKPSESEKYYAMKNSEYEFQRKNDELDRKIEDDIRQQWKENTRSFDVPIILKNIPSDMNITSDKYLTVYYRDNGVTGGINYNTTEFEKIKKVIFKGDPKATLDFSKDVLKYELDQVRKKLNMAEISGYPILGFDDTNGFKFNLKEDNGLFLILSDYGYTLCDIDGFVSPSVNIEVSFSKKSKN